VAEAVNHLKVRSCLIDGEVVCCDEKGVAAFQMLRHRRNEPTPRTGGATLGFAGGEPLHLVRNDDPGFRCPRVFRC
jgi:hypothetical protein